MPRDFSHDYRRAQIYHLTITKAPGIQDFSAVSGAPDAPVINKTLIGKVIEQNIWNLHSICEKLKVLQYILMPDHLHILLYVTSAIERPLGSYIGTFKVRITQQLREYGYETPVFTPDFYDRILRRNHSLNTIYEYIRTNPHRLLVRRTHPEYFRRVNSLMIANERWDAYGNMLLLKNPFKEQVVIHRKDSDETQDQNRNRWLYAAANGGVLVSPFVSPKEKEIRLESDSLGGKSILITNEPFGERYKPGGRNFQLCERGQLLIIAPKNKLPAGRETFLYLNRIAEIIAASG